MIDPKISAYFSALAKKRKNPYYTFKEDKTVAKKAQAKSVRSRYENRDKGQASKFK
jgi:hypothetical protein